MADRVVYTIREGVADVRMNRPEKMNAIDTAMFEALSRVGRELAGMKSIRAVVLSGEGRAFCAGLDFSSFQSMADAKSSRSAAENVMADHSAENPANLAQQAGYVWHVMPVPVIAAIHGVAFGGGLQIALGADIRIIEPDARVSILEIKWGLVPDMSGTQMLRDLARLDVVKELTYTGRIIDGLEAVTLGLATRVSDAPYEDAMKLAHEIATKSPDAIRAGKKLLNASRRVTIEEGFRLEEDLQRSVIGTPNQVEAVLANLENRKPDFKDPR
ncbi:MAG: crotonase/enoyl-CoA hydratase family protein [Proteobacteria bacterium]|nr:crotonase/enoyl-CoA hydratase family protein [Pseudomonadota bacterium]MBU4470232.1 crotonase/enoyl-CoA hydratase family protein [Pseudomonadota bacterium]MCG2752647.1 crotonase/enoyl-CoA hydratase family protein [Desulfobacteraceae bacterium]